MLIPFWTTSAYVDYDEVCSYVLLFTVIIIIMIAAVIITIILI